MGKLRPGPPAQLFLNARRKALPAAHTLVLSAQRASSPCYFLPCACATPACTLSMRHSESLTIYLAVTTFYPSLGSLIFNFRAYVFCGWSAVEL